MLTKTRVPLHLSPRSGHPRVLPPNQRALPCPSPQPPSSAMPESPSRLSRSWNPQWCWGEPRGCRECSPTWLLTAAFAGFLLNFPEPPVQTLPLPGGQSQLRRTHDLIYSKETGTTQRKLLYIPSLLPQCYHLLNTLPSVLSSPGQEHPPSASILPPHPPLHPLSLSPCCLGLQEAGFIRPCRMIPPD